MTTTIYQCNKCHIPLVVAENEREGRVALCMECGLTRSIEVIEVYDLEVQTWHGPVSGS
jgi:DNA-directed RNA polymerase subunit RPC12/RpoP